MVWDGPAWRQLYHFLSVGPRLLKSGGELNTRYTCVHFSSLCSWLCLWWAQLFEAPDLTSLPWWTGTWPCEVRPTPSEQLFFLLLLGYFIIDTEVEGEVSWLWKSHLPWSRTLDVCPQVHFVSAVYFDQPDYWVFNCIGFIMAPTLVSFIFIHCFLLLSLFPGSDDGGQDEICLYFWYGYLVLSVFL